MDSDNTIFVFQSPQWGSNAACCMLMLTWQTPTSPRPWGRGCHHWGTVPSTRTYLDTNKELFCTQDCAVYEVQGLGQRIGPKLLCRSRVELERIQGPNMSRPYWLHIPWSKRISFEQTNPLMTLEALRLHHSSLWMSQWRDVNSSWWHRNYVIPWSQNHQQFWWNWHWKLVIWI